MASLIPCLSLIFFFFQWRHTLIIFLCKTLLQFILLLEAVCKFFGNSLRNQCESLNICSPCSSWSKQSSSEDLDKYLLSNNENSPVSQLTQLLVTAWFLWDAGGWKHRLLLQHTSCQRRWVIPQPSCQCCRCCSSFCPPLSRSSCSGGAKHPTALCRGHLAVPLRTGLCEQVAVLVGETWPLSSEWIFLQTK